MPAVQCLVRLKLPSGAMDRTQIERHVAKHPRQRQRSTVCFLSNFCTSLTPLGSLFPGMFQNTTFLREWNRTYGQTGLLNLRFLNTQQGMDQNLAPLICLLDRHQLPSPILKSGIDRAPSIEFGSGIAKDHVVSFDRTTAMIEQIAKVV